jgi:hypothetical protein
MFVRSRVIVFFIFLAGFSSGCPAQGRTNIPEIDSLPLDDWLVKTPPLSYTKGLLFSALFPGGGQIYGKHYVRAGFLIGIEGFLFTDVLFYKHNLLKSKNREIGLYIDSAVIALEEYADDPGNKDLLSDFTGFMGKARRRLDNKMVNMDTRRAEVVWALGLHFYGIMDAMEIIHKSRQDSSFSLSGNSAFWWGLLIPGGGQLYNRKFGKFGMLWMALGAGIVSAYQRQQMVDYFQNRINAVKAESADESLGNSDLDHLKKRVTEYRKKRNQYFWAMTLLHLYAVGDAVVDAILNDFDTPDKFALVPGETPLSFMLLYHF